MSPLPLRLTVAEDWRRETATADAARHFARSPFEPRRVDLITTPDARRHARWLATPRPTRVASLRAAHRSAAPRAIGQRIAAEAEHFIGTPYDTDPLGLYVRTRRIVADEAVDCMYLVFRATELARSMTPRGALDAALDLRFHTRGRLDADGRVANYDERFDYGEDMITSGKWGRDVTATLGGVQRLAGTRHHDHVDVLPRDELLTTSALREVRDGDIVYFVLDPAARKADAIVGHLGIAHVIDGVPHLIHASGHKAHGDDPGGGAVKEVPLATYAAQMRFVGVMVTRFAK